MTFNEVFINPLSVLRYRPERLLHIAPFSLSLIVNVQVVHFEELFILTLP